MVRPEQKRKAASAIITARSRSVARACKLTGLARSTFDHKMLRDQSNDEILLARMRELVDRHKRFGLPRLHALLKKEGLVVNRKRTARIYAEAKLQLKKRKRKKLSRMPRLVLPQATRPNEVWSIDFVFDWLHTKRKLKSLTIVDDFSKESVGIFPGHSISGAEVTRFIDSLGVKPKRIRSDNGPEFVSTAMFVWFEERKIEHELITPGKPNENAFIESFNSRFRDECLNEHVFIDLNDARTKIEAWRKTYNEVHPHSSLGMKSPNEFAKDWKEMLSA